MLLTLQVEILRMPAVQFCLAGLVLDSLRSQKSHGGTEDVPWMLWLMVDG